MGTLPADDGSRTFRSLRNRNYRLFFAGQVISVPGTWMQTVGQSWLVLKLSHDSAFAVGLVTALQFVPMLLLGPVAGVMADRYDKRRMLLVTQSWLGLTAAALGAIVLAGTARLWMVYVLAIVYGLGAVMDVPTRQAFASELVGQDDLPNAVGLNSIVFNGARIIGPALAAATIAGLGIGWCFVLNALSFVAALIALGRIDAAALERSIPVPRAKRQIRDGILYAWRVPDLRSQLLLMAVFGTFAYNYPVVLPLLAKRTFAGNASTFSLLTAAMGVGAVIGAVYQARRTRLTGYTTYTMLAVSGAAAAVGAIVPSVWVLGVVMVVVGAANTTIFTNSNTLIQLRAAPEMRGRVVALRALVVLGGAPIGGPVVGALMEATNPRAGLILAAATAALCVVGYGAALRRETAAGTALTVSA
ncbi:MAG: MFS transporter [Acidimicrobiia bacterium]